ncbi:uncharacterized protein LOC131853802 [Achroia grisella]|uniref:uncharacterized protein LOC131853802 n=1 Tax=Achroia grisella TaxID=688607 RepID=UPI0027D21458|nr:uncharacterized protein LOC131853802 [Achroia grisella]
MTGKSYTMKEMKSIVEYLVAHRVYGEVKGRKMWMDFASTSETSRTWQSLKETFLKRILPDIHNPYYKLTKEQILSFRQGYDIETREKNKLEVCAVGEESISKDESTNKAHPSTSNDNEGEKVSGEDEISSKIPLHNRASTETIVLDSDAIEKELESPKCDKRRESQEENSYNKKLRDCITYAEPPTPSILQVLHDFVTDESDDSSGEPVLKIDENITSDIEKQSSKTQTDDKSEDNNNKSNIENGPERVSPSTVVVNNSKSIENTSVNEKPDPTKQIENEVIAEDNNKNNTSQLDASSKLKNNTQSSSVNSNDTELPGNQEEFASITHQKTKGSSENGDFYIILDSNKTMGNTKIKLSRRRANSEDISINAEKKKNVEQNNKQKSISEAGSDVADHQNELIHPSSLTDKDNKKKTSNVLEIDKNNEDQCNRMENTSPANRSEEISSSQLNPCLKSVSLFAEQFNTTKYSDSESVEEVTSNKNGGKNENNEAHSSANPPKETIQDNVEKDKIKHASIDINSVVILKSRSESDSDNGVPSKKIKNIDPIHKLQREKALASIFGFSTGGMVKRRKRNLSCQKPSTSQRYSQTRVNDKSLESSEWTSESDFEYTSPPRGRKYRQSRKYVKPKSARILSLQEEGGLFVMHGKKIYPLVKDGNIIKNYLTYESEDDQEEDPTYWKKKYEEEKRKTEQLKVLLDVAKESKNVREVSPILPTHSLRKIPKLQNSASPSKSNETKELLPVQTEKKEENTEEKRVKIKFTKNNEEVQLEGHWSHIHPVLAEVVQFFNKDEKDGARDVPVTNGSVARPCNRDLKPVTTVPVTTVPVPTASATAEPEAALPYDEEVRKKVNTLESEIFKEIEDRDKEELADSTDQENITKRKKPSRPPKLSDSNDSTSTTNTSRSPRPKRSMRNSKADKIEVENLDTIANTNVGNNSVTPRKRQSKKSIKVIEQTTNTPDKNKRNNLNSESESKLNESNNLNEDDEIRYMFPPNQQTNRKHTGEINKRQRPRRSLTGIHKLCASANQPENSIDSTQGYQDSDVSPSSNRIVLRRKRKSSFSNVLRKRKIILRYGNQRKSHPYFSDDTSNESNSQSQVLGHKSNSTLNPEVYKSESYQMLMPQDRYNFGVLNKIEENHTTPNELANSNLSKPPEIHIDNDINEKNVHQENNSSDSIRGSIEAVNSSSVSLPLSPELSIVEQLSVSRELLKSFQDRPSINEIQALNEEANGCINPNKYLISDLDVSMPLMEQICQIQKNSPSKCNTNIPNTSTISQSVLDKIDVNIKEASISDSLDLKLRNLLLESAKKMQVSHAKTSRNISNNNENIEITSDINLKNKAKSKKRCSTPCKRKDTKKRKLPDIGPVVEEECMEFCSHGGREPFPPIPILTSELTKSNNEINEGNPSENANTGNKRKKLKKDILKVKILRPKNKNPKKDRSDFENKPRDCSRVSAQTDSGINDASHLFVESLNDSIDLIHNHSDTCLQTNECMDSVELIEAKRSIISLNTNSGDSPDRFIFVARDSSSLSNELFCSNAQDGANMTCAKVGSNNDSVYHSPIASEISANSLITEDLSDELPCLSGKSPLTNIPTSKWYLLSEDETTNTNLQTPSVGANLNQIFPITCAVPNLSTITEMSKETEDNSRKPTIDISEDIKTNFDSQCLFNFYLS